ncbi:MAG: hypothetical protein L6V85_05720 [Clostridiales bacterium]|nr:MAG: hypothetical protein L6V85_05720 [Clostridiales bacterium]
MSKFQAKSKEMIFESDNVKVAILRLALPTIVSQLITTVYNLADTFWVGKLNDSYQLAALSIIFPVQLFMTALGNLFGIGAGTCISNYLGAKENDKAKTRVGVCDMGRRDRCGVAVAYRGRMERAVFKTAEIDRKP